MLSFTSLAVLLPALALASPVTNKAARASSASATYTINTSTCSSDQAAAIRAGLDGAVTLADAASKHLLSEGQDAFYERWFGKGKASGDLYENIKTGNAGVAFTCEDVDSRCTGRPGYQTASDPNLTVICKEYYGSRKPVSELCAGGDTINQQGTESTQGSFFMHRLLHLPAISGGKLQDVVDSAHDAVQLAKSDPASAVENIHTVQYYALDVYAADVLLPGKGCLGDTSIQVAIPDDD